MAKFRLLRGATEVYAAREKNGIYLPRERYFQDEAEKKVIALRLSNF